MNQKILTADLYKMNFDRNERATLLLLQEQIPKLGRDEKITLVLLLINLYSVGVGRRWVFLRAASPGFSEELSTVSLQIPLLPRFLQLAIAIELLESEKDSQQ